MNYELLLSWMAHVGEGSWGAFRRAVDQLADRDGDEESRDVAPRRARRALAELGHVAFFVGDGADWTVCAPVLGGLPSGAAAVLCGARTPALVDGLRACCEAAGCRVLLEEQSFAPPRIEVAGNDQALRQAADASGIPFVPNLPRVLAASVESVRASIDNAQNAEPPINWAHSCLDLETLAWSDEIVTKTAHRYRSRYGPTRYFVDAPGRSLVTLDGRTAIYAAALVNSLDLVEYDASAQRLSTPLRAPLPAAYARAASLCRGRLGTVAEGRATYEEVPADVGSVLTVASGASYPMPSRWFGPQAD